MLIKLNLEDYTNLLRTAAMEALANSPVGRRTGALMNSIRVTVEGTEEDPIYNLTFNDYGLFLDEGVQGTLGGSTAGGFQGLAFKYSGAFKMIGGNLPYGARRNIYKFGLKPRPWVQSAVDAIGQMAAMSIERDLPKEIEDEIVRTINSLQPININA